MTVVTKTKPIEYEELGDKIKLEVSPYYLKVIIGRKTYYFDKDGGLAGTGTGLRNNIIATW